MGWSVRAEPVRGMDIDNALAGFLQLPFSFFGDASAFPSAACPRLRLNSAIGERVNEGEIVGGVGRPEPGDGDLAVLCETGTGCAVVMSKSGRVITK